MITVSLDEQGVFEHIEEEQDKKIVMVAGIIYDDHGYENDTQREKSRIKNYFTNVCQTHNAPYPRALHAGGIPIKVVAMIKSEYSDTLGEFLKNGTYHEEKVLSDDGIDRQGEYYVYAMIKSPKGKPELSSDDVSNLIKEDYASNLYMHMAEDVISRILFYNNYFLDKESVSLDLATRVYKGDVGEIVSEHLTLGYEELPTRKGDIVYLTNTHVFRTALAREMLYETENDILIKSLEARSINYFKDGKDLELLYLADAICTYVGFKTKYTSPSYVQKAWDKMGELTGDNRLLFLYDSVDTSFVKAWKYVDSGNIYKALSTFYDSIDEGTKEAAFYRDHWKTVLLEHMDRRVDASAFAMAVRQFAQSTRNNNLKPEKLLFIYESLHVLKDKIVFSNPQDKAVLYDLYDAGVATYNHVGNTVKSRECLKMCDHYAKYAGVERELRNRNKYAVSLCDSLEFDKAIDVALDTYEYYEKIYEVQKNVFGDDNANVHDFGIISSQLGQCYAYKKDNKAEKYLIEALKLFDKGTPDYFQTQSYLLHYYIQTGAKDKYIEYSREYFGNKTEILEQLKYIVSEGTKKSNPLISLNFALFVYIKGLYTFFVDELSETESEKIIKLEENLTSLKTDLTDYIQEYPWVLIYKYLAMICARKRNPMLNVYTKKIRALEMNMGILKLIKHCALLNIYRSVGNNNFAIACNKEIESAYEELIDNNDKSSNMDADSINNIITFMYM